MKTAKFSERLFTQSTAGQAIAAAAAGIDPAPTGIQIATPGLLLRSMIAAGHDRLSLPGHGATLERWRALAAVAGRDLSLLKLYEGHTDALAILAEAGALALDAPGSAAWGVWCAEPPDARLSISADPAGGEGAVRISGVKAWCSGAAELSHALVSGWDACGRQCLAAVQLHQAGVVVTGEGWNAIGMAATASVNVRFEAARGQMIGGPGFYTGRPGFWHGGAGIAACWYGAAAALADMLHGKLRQKAPGSRDPHALAHLGAADVALSAAAGCLRETAQWIDAFPAKDARLPALRARLAVEKAAGEVIGAAGRAMGAAAFCRDSDSARMLADLPVFLRQSHAENDLAAVGGITLESNASPWIL
ncbi:MAG TPA: acyl-CoA dehydrogenase [Herbaspirillum sp.]|jgi:hypothetical protein